MNENEDPFGDISAQALQAHNDIILASRGARLPSVRQRNALRGIDQPGRYGFTPLLSVCVNESTSDIKGLLRMGADPNVENTISLEATEYRTTPLIYSCHSGAEASVRCLLEWPTIDVNKAVSDDGITPLFVACQDGRDDIVRMLVARDDIALDTTTTGRFGATALFIACQEGHHTVVELMIRHGADANLVLGRSGRTPLGVACAEGHTNVVRELLQSPDANVDVSMRMRTGISPLMDACGTGKIEIVSMLLAHPEIDTSVLHCTDSGVTALHFAVIGKNIAIVKLLVLFGASTTVKDDDGFSPTQYAHILDLHDINQWLHRAATLPRLHLAAECRQHGYLLRFLRSGSINPDLEAAEAVIAARAAATSTLPNICRITAALVLASTSGWSPKTHWLYAESERTAVITMLLVYNRLSAQGANPPLPFIPPEIWLLFVFFIQRGWWRE